MSLRHFNIVSKISGMLLASLFILAQPTHAQKFVQDENLNQGGTELTSEQKQERQLKNIASINGLLVGYGFSCELPKDQIEKIHNAFYALSGSAKDNKITILMRNEYQEKVNTGRDKGPVFSGIDCNFIKEEYNKILAQIEQETKETNGAMPTTAIKK